MDSRRGYQNAFTLIEVLVSLIIFGIITAALSMAFSVSIHAQQRLTAYRRDDAIVREIFGTLQTDLAAAYPSPTDPTSLFVANTQPQGQTTQFDAGLLTLSTFTGRIQNTDPALDPLMAQSSSSSSLTSMSNTLNGSQNSSQPQWDEQIVKYTLSPNGTLRRQVIGVPNLQLLSSQGTDTSTGISDSVARNVKSLTLQFWDPVQQTWVPTWDFEQPLYAQYLTQLKQQNSQSTQGSGAAGSQSSVSSLTNGSGNETLPPFVKITLVLVGPDGQPETYETETPVGGYEPIQPNIPPPPTTSTGTQSSGSGSGATTQ